VALNGRPIVSSSKVLMKESGQRADVTGGGKVTRRADFPSSAPSPGPFSYCRSRVGIFRVEGGRGAKKRRPGCICVSGKRIAEAPKYPA